MLFDDDFFIVELGQLDKSGDFVGLATSLMHNIFDSEHSHFPGIMSELFNEAKQKASKVIIASYCFAKKDILPEEFNLNDIASQHAMTSLKDKFNQVLKHDNNKNRLAVIKEVAELKKIMPYQPL